MNIGFNDREFGSLANGAMHTPTKSSSLPHFEFLIHFAEKLREAGEEVERVDRELSDRSLDDGLRAAKAGHRIRLLSLYDQLTTELADRLQVPKARRASLLASPRPPSRTTRKERA